MTLSSIRDFIFAFFILVFFSRIFRFTSENLIYIDAIIAFIIAPISFFLIFNIKSKELKFIRQYIIIFIFLVLISVLQASFFWNQPTFMTILTEARLFFPLAFILFLRLYPAEFSSLGIGISLSYLIIGLHLVFSFSTLSGLSFWLPESLIGDDDIRGARLRLPLTLPVLMCALLLTKDYKSSSDFIFITLTTLTVIFLSQGRIHSLILALIFGVILFQNLFGVLSGRKFSIYHAIVAIPLILLVFIGITYVGGNTLTTINSLFISQGSSDLSAASRALQFVSMISIVQDTFPFGIGKLSLNHSTNFETLFGYFHFEDLGIIGIFAVYGFLGVFLVLFIMKNFYSYLLNSHESRVARFIIFLPILIIVLATGEIFLYPGIFIYYFFIVGSAKYLR